MVAWTTLIPVVVAGQMNRLPVTESTFLTASFRSLRDVLSRFFDRLASVFYCRFRMFCWSFRVVLFRLLRFGFDIVRPSFAHGP